MTFMILIHIRIFTIIFLNYMTLICRGNPINDYLLNADGALSESPSGLLARRFLNNPQGILSAMSVVEKSTWKNRGVIVPSVGYTAAVWFSDEERTEFEEILDSDTAAQSDSEHAVLDVISDAYKRSLLRI
jgi:hypothetical protein